MALTTPNIVRLTSANPDQASSLLYTTPVPSTNGLRISFDFYAYGGTGADGISFFFVDGSEVQPRAGGFGGSLGYAQRLNEAGVFEPGVPGGYLGIGFDEYGNFSNPTEGRVGGRRFLPDAIAVRGSETMQYQYLTGTGTLPVSLDNPGPAATRDNSRRTAQITLSPTGLLTVEVDLNGNGTFTDPGELAINQFDVPTANGSPLPANFKFGFAAATGEKTNIHEVGNFNIATFDGAPIAGNFTGDLIVTGGDGNDPIVGDIGNDTLTGGGGNDVITGNAGNDQIIGGTGGDSQTGDTGADRFIFSGANKAQALRSSTLRSLDRITDFRFGEGDRFQLDFDNNLQSVERPKRLYNVGRVRAKTLQAAVKAAYSDKLTRRNGNQPLKADEAVFFRFGSRTFLSVNDGRAPFAPPRDLLAEVTGIQFKPGDSRPAALAVGNYFA